LLVAVAMLIIVGLIVVVVFGIVGINIGVIIVLWLLL